MVICFCLLCIVCFVDLVVCVCGVVLFVYLDLIVGVYFDVCWWKWYVCIVV